MPVLLIVGIGLLLFGGIVLLKFPHKPGGKISIGSFEVSSMGAGLPFMVLGVICLFTYSGAGTGVLDLWPFQSKGPRLPGSPCFQKKSRLPPFYGRLLHFPGSNLRVKFGSLPEPRRDRAGP